MLNRICAAVSIALLLTIPPATWAGQTGPAEVRDRIDDHPGQPPFVELNTEPEALKAGIPATLVFSLKDGGGNPLQKLDITHERILHIVIVSEDFRVFAHLHPEDSGPVTQEMKEEARFPVRFTFPKAGRYLVAVDSAAGGRHFSRQLVADVTGEPRMEPRRKDLSREGIFGAYRVVFTSSPERIRAGEHEAIGYRFTRNGAPVTDLEPYLSAPMHIAIVKSDLSAFIHEHGELPGHVHAGGHEGHHHAMEAPGSFGPEIDAHISFPSPGLYTIFGEVKHRGKVITTEFTVEVK